MAKSITRLVNSETFSLSLASLSENFWIRAAQKFSICFCAHDFAAFE